MTDLMNPEQLPPHNRDAEQGVLGGILRDPAALHFVPWLKADDFFHDAHQCVYRAILALEAARQPIDLVLLFEYLQREKQLENVGGRAYLADLWEAVSTGANVEYHAVLIRDAAIVRRLIHAANEILRDAHARCQSADELVAAAEKKILAVADARVSAKEPRIAAEFMREAVEEIDTRIAAGGHFSGMATGYIDLDELFGGIEGGEVVIVAARPSVGKTAWTVNALVKIASAGQPVLFFSAEQPEKAIAQRMLSMGSGVPMHRFTRSRTLSDADAGALVYAASAEGLGGCPVYIDDTPGPSAQHIGHVLRRAIRKHGIACAAIDYLQLLSPDDHRAPKHVQIGDLSKRIKNLARECGIPIFLLSQLSRDVEKRGGQPRLSDLRESGGIEQDADRVLFLHIEGDPPKHQDVWPVEGLVRKNRNGPIGDVTFAYRRPVMRFEDMVKGDIH